MGAEDLSASSGVPVNKYKLSFLGGTGGGVIECLLTDLFLCSAAAAFFSASFLDKLCWFGRAQSLVVQHLTSFHLSSFSIFLNNSEFLSAAEILVLPALGLVMANPSFPVGRQVELLGVHRQICFAALVGQLSSLQAEEIGRAHV